MCRCTSELVRELPGEGCAGVCIRGFAMCCSARVDHLYACILHCMCAHVEFVCICACVYVCVCMCVCVCVCMCVCDYFLNCALEDADFSLQALDGRFHHVPQRSIACGRSAID